MILAKIGNLKQWRSLGTSDRVDTPRCMSLALGAKSIYPLKDKNEECLVLTVLANCRMTTSIHVDFMGSEVVLKDVRESHFTILQMMEHDKEEPQNIEIIINGHEELGLEAQRKISGKEI